MAECIHVYQEVAEDPCELCNKPSHRMNWEEQNRMMVEWRLANPNAKSDGWWSI
jgi:hypothetical protein